MKSSRTQNKNTKKDLQAFNYKVILLKSKLTNIIQLGKEKNQITEFSWISSSYTIYNPHTAKKARIVLSEASLQQKLSRKYGMWPFFSIP